MFGFMSKLSIIIPARNEMFLKETIEDILKKMRGDTEVIAVLGAYWPNPPIKDHPKVTLIHTGVAGGQRGDTNKGVNISKSKYVMKCDAHCGFDEGFDVKLMEDMQDDWTIVPVMRNLWAFDWVCECGHREYQGPTHNCPKCGKPLKKDMKWIGKTNPQNDSYRFDTEPHFQYFREYRKNPKYQEDLKTGLTETMSLQGSCFMLTRYRYKKLNICDENFGGWGSQGIEVACKTWLSGGKCICSHKTWYAHMFRTQGGDFGFPYPLSAREQDKAKKYSRELFFNNKWSKQVHPLSWLLEKFWPVPGWTEEDIKKLKTNNN